MTSINTIALDAARTGIAIAASRGFDVPSTLTERIDELQELRRLANTQPAQRPTLTGPLSGYADQLRKIAETEAKITTTANMADQYVGQAVSDVLGQYRTALPGWLDALADQAEPLITEVRESLPVAPVTIGPYADDGQVAAFRRAGRAAGDLDAVVVHRVLMGQSIGEAGCTDRSVFIVASVPTPPADGAAFERVWPGVHDFIVKEYSALALGVERWRALLESGFPLGIAGAGGIEQRLAGYQRWNELNGVLHQYGGGAAFAKAGR